MAGKKRITTASAKAKARKLQQLVRDKLLATFPMLTDDDVVSCPMGSTGSDIKLSQAAKSLIPFDFEAKARAKIGLVYDALAQAQRDPNRTPVAVIKADRKPALVVMEADAWFAMLSALVDEATDK